MTLHLTFPTRLVRTGATATVLVTAGVLTLTACSGSSSGSGTAKVSSAAPSSAAAGSAGARGGGGGTPPATYGTIAAVQPGSMEVQDPSTGQTTVSYTASTAITNQQAAALADVKAGVCVTATASGTGASGAASPSAAPNAGQPRTITASTVLITSPINGTCGGFGPAAGTGARPSFSPPSNRPAGAPSGNRGAVGAAVTGQVAAVSGDVITVSSARRARTSTSSSAAPTTTTDTVQVTGSTTFRQTVTATSAALVVGRCVTAEGTSDSTGAVAATRIAVSEAGAQGCTQFGRFGGRGGSAGAAPSGAPTS